MKKKLLRKFCIMLLFFSEMMFPVIAQSVSEIKRDSIRILTITKGVDSLRYLNADSALILALGALDIAKNSHYEKGLATTYTAIGNVYLEKQDFKSAVFYYFKSLKRHQELGNKLGEANVTNNIGAAYMMIAQNAKAKVFINKAIQLKEEYDLPFNTIVSFNNLGTIAYNEGKYQEAAFYYSRALEQENIGNIHNLRNTVRTNLGIAYTELAQYDSAVYCFESILKQKVEPPTFYQQARCYMSLGALALKRKQLKVAEEYLIKTKGLSEQLDNKKLTQDVNQELAKLYELKGDYKLAFKHYTKYKQWSDSIYSEEVQKQIGEIQAEFETVQKDEQIKSLFKDKELAEAKAAREQSVKRLFIVFVVLALIILAVLLRNVLLKQKFNKVLVDKNKFVELKNEELEQKNELIETQKLEIEKSALQLSRYNDELTQENILAKYEVLKSKTNPHFLFNSLNTLSALIIKDQKDALRFIDHFSDLYRRVLETSEQNLITLSQEMEIVTTYFYLQQKRFGSDLQTFIQIDPKWNQFYLPPFAIQLMVENAIKHNIITEEEKLKITITIDNEMVVITNNLNKKSSHTTSTSIGQKNLLERYRLISDKLPQFIEGVTEYKVVLPIFTSQPV